MSIDTSTTAGKIAVMQHFDLGGEVQARFRENGSGTWSLPETKETRGDDMIWDWRTFDFRIKPSPRQFYVHFYKDGSANVYASRREADRDYSPRVKEQMIVREVIE